MLHRARDAIVPVMHGEALLEAAPGPKRMHVFPGAGHNDRLAEAGDEWVRAIAVCAGERGSG